jgi:lipopolysaccharide transport system permease protein
MTIKKHTHPVSSIIKHRGMLLRVARNDFRTRFAGSVLGTIWLFVVPLFFILVYAATYLFIFRIQPENMSSTQYILHMFAGLNPFFSISEALTSGASSIKVSRELLSNNVFPVELVPVKAVLLAQSHQFVGFMFILVISLVVTDLPMTALLVVVVWFLQLLFLIGLMWGISLIVVVLPDIEYVLSMIVRLLILASPIAYTADMIPKQLKLIVYLNPVAYYIMGYQDLWVRGKLPGLAEWIVMTIVSVGAFLMGGILFMRLKNKMIDFV